MDLGLTGKRVIITAGAAGIGLATARAFRKEGASVVVCDVDQGALDALTTSDPDITGFVADVSDREVVGAFMEQALSRLGGLDALVNNAGIAGPTGPAEDILPDEWDRCLAVCLTGQFNLARLAIPALRQSENASITNLSSMAGKFGFRYRAAYAAAKWGVVGFTQSLALELGPDGVRVNCVQPGLVAGDRIRRVFEAKAQRTGRSFEAVGKRCPLLHRAPRLRDGGPDRGPDPVPRLGAGPDDHGSVAGGLRGDANARLSVAAQAASHTRRFPDKIRP